MPVNPPRPMVEIMREHAKITAAAHAGDDWAGRRFSLRLLEIEMEERAEADLLIILAPARVHDAQAEFRELAAWNAYKTLHVVAESDS